MRKHIDDKYGPLVAHARKHVAYGAANISRQIAGMSRPAWSSYIEVTFVSKKYLLAA